MRLSASFDQKAYIEIGWRYWKDVTWSTFVEYIIFGKRILIVNHFFTYESKEISLIHWSFQKLFQSPGMGVNP